MGASDAPARAMKIVAAALAAAVAPDDREVEAQARHARRMADIAPPPIAPFLGPVVVATRPAPGSREARDAEALCLECAKMEAEMALLALNEARLAEAREIFDRAYPARVGRPGAVPLSVPAGRLVFVPAKRDAEER